MNHNTRYVKRGEMMDEKQIVETLATKVMGWQVRVDVVFVGKHLYYRSNDGDFTHWNPLQKIADAWMLVEKLKEQDISIEIHIDDGECIVRVNNDRWFSNKEAPKAICTAMFEYSTQL
jgi:hypothetical protein